MTDAIDSLRTCDVAMWAADKGVISTEASTRVYSPFTVGKVCLEVNQISANWRLNPLEPELFFKF